jgi:uncharacterized protein (TIGR03086 family)
MCGEPDGRVDKRHRRRSARRLPGEIAAVVALEELVIHGWDVACATGQAYECEDAELGVVNGFIAQIANADPAVRGDAYAGPVRVSDGVPYLDRVVASSGRDPHWIGRKKRD